MTNDDDKKTENPIESDILLDESARNRNDVAIIPSSKIEFIGNAGKMAIQCSFYLPHA